MAARTYASDEFDYLLEADPGPLSLVAGERFRPGHGLPAGSSMLRALAVIAVMGGGGWGWMQLPQSWRESVVAQATALASEVMRRASPDKTEPNTEMAAASPLPDVQQREVAAAPGAEAGTAVPQPPAAALPPEAVPASENTAPASEAQTAQQAAAQTNTEPATTPEAAQKEVPAPLATPVADPKDKYQQKALAAGLHPDLSRAVLHRLSKDDFKNAGIAIKSALKKSTAQQPVIYPLKAPAKAAQFEVRFVAAAAPRCRRYVVTVTLDRWSTTAPPMETCGEDQSRRKAAIRG